MSKRMQLKEAAEELGMSQHYLRTEMIAGRIPHLRAGNRYILDIEQVEEFLKYKAMKNLKLETEIIDYGRLRKVNT
jgi:excisionase family DNA binding protein